MGTVSIVAVMTKLSKFGGTIENDDVRLEGDRVYFGYLFASPHMLSALALALFSSDRKQKIRKILQML